MNKDLINQLIESREKLTNVRDEVIRHDLVDFIDAQLAQIPSGEDNRVDLLLGRQCAELPERPDYGVQDAPQDYRIANRPNNPNWHGVAAWFDDAAAELAEHDAEVKPGYFVNPVITLQLEAETISVFDAEMRRLCADYEPVEPTYDGMWK